MPDAAVPPPARPGVVLGLTFLLLGLTFALPFQLVPPTARGQNMSAETANVYACAAWAGWAHFLYAFRGQGTALLRLRDASGTGRLAAYLVSLLFIIGALALVRGAVGLAIFSAVVWVCFIDHFVKAELAFEGKSLANDLPWRRWLSSYQPLLAFAWLSMVLHDVGGVTSQPWLMWIVSIAVAGLVLFTSGLRELGHGDARNPLLALFFVAEALVWGTFNRFGGPMFNTGVYIFHIAAGSYFHYLGSYYVGLARSKGKDRLLGAPAVIGVNVVIIAVGVVVAYNDSLSWLRPVLGVEWFTLWVAVHLVASDAFPMIKRYGAST